MSKRELYFKHSEREVERCLRGMLINMHGDWVVMDTADPEPVGGPPKP